MNLKRVASKVGKHSKRALLGSSKGAVAVGKVGVSAAKLANMVQPGSGDQAIQGARSLKSAGRLGRQTARGDTAKNRQRVAKLEKTTASLRGSSGMSYK